MFIPNTPLDQKEMLAKIGVSSVKELLSQIPQDLLYPVLICPKPLRSKNLPRIYTRWRRKINRSTILLAPVFMNILFPPQLMLFLRAGNF